MTSIELSPAAPVERTTMLRYAQATGFVTLWMLLGVCLRLAGLGDAIAANSYLLLGVPLMVVFERFVRRQRLATLWIRDADRLQLGWVGWCVSALFAIVPAYSLTKCEWSQPIGIITSLWLGAAIVGALGVGFCTSRMTWASLRKGLPGCITAIALGALFMAAAALANGKPVWAAGKILLGLQQFLLYFPVCFVIEEVAFRGLLDTHVQPFEARGWSRWWSAIAISLLWGLWHLPILPIPDVLSAIILAPAISFTHILICVPLSLCWRASGSLLLPCAAHALIDAYRNTILF